MMKKKLYRMELVHHHELQTIFGAGLKSWFKKAVKWVKKHVRLKKKSITIRGEHDIGGGGR